MCRHLGRAPALRAHRHLEEGQLWAGYPWGPGLGWEGSHRRGAGQALCPALCDIPCSCRPATPCPGPQAASGGLSSGGGGQLPAILGAGAGPLPGAVHGTLTPHGAARPRGRASRGEEPGRELSREEGRASCHYLCDLPRGRYCYLYFCSLGSQAAAASWPREGEGWPKNTKHLQLGTECRVGL